MSGLLRQWGEFLAAVWHHRFMPTSNAHAITHRGEFVDALTALRRGGIIVRLDDDACLLDGVRLMWSFDELLRHDLVTEYDNPQGFAGARYYRMTRTGRDFADNAIAAWRARPWLERMAIRLFG